MTRPSWDAWALVVAAAVATRGDCTRRQVGAVICDAQHRIIGAGYNGVKPGARGCLDGACPRGHLGPADVPHGAAYDDCIANHAEIGALMNSDALRFKAGTIYISTDPCTWCLKVLRCSGLARAVWPGGEVSL